MDPGGRVATASRRESGPDTVIVRQGAWAAAAALEKSETASRNAPIGRRYADLIAASRPPFVEHTALVVPQQAPTGHREGNSAEGPFPLAASVCGGSSDGTELDGELPPGPAKTDPIRITGRALIQTGCQSSGCRGRVDLDGDG